MKLCPDCQQLLPEESFYKFSTGASKSKSFYCKPCSRIRGNKWAEKNRSELRLKQEKYLAIKREKTAEKKRAKAEYFEAHKEEILAEQAARKKATREREKAKRKEDYRKNPEKYKAWAKKYYEKNPGKNKAQYLRYRAENLERCLQKSREAYHKNKAKVCEYYRRRRMTDPVYRMKITLGSRIRCAMKEVGGVKSKRTRELIGCDVEFLRAYLEARFLPGMTWENRGFGEGKWHIDHRIPCAKFDLLDPEQQRQCFHYSNLQPLWGVDNHKKSDRMPPTHQAELL